MYAHPASKGRGGEKEGRKGREGTGIKEGEGGDDGEKISKISLFVLAQLTNVTDRWTDRQTPHAGNSHAYA